VEAMKQAQITTIICLVSDKEINQKSPDYAVAIAAGKIPAERICFPIPNYTIKHGSTTEPQAKI
jgi:hypothetical protein